MFQFRSWLRGKPSPDDVFAPVARGRLVEAPFPHLVVEDAIPRKLADILLAAMPPEAVFTRESPPGSNARFALPSPVALADPRAAEEWKEAMRTCNAALGSLLGHFMRRFAGHLLRAYPDFPTRFAPPEELRAIPRARAGRRRHEIGVDAQMVVNTPAREAATRVRGPHLDQPDKLISGLLYLRAPDDDSTGGDLELYAPAEQGITFNANNEAPREKFRVVHTYPYRHNLLILPLNTPAALHGVSPRGKTDKPRYHLHLVGELNAPLFTVPH